jgi:hypothetical protein
MDWQTYAAAGIVTLTLVIFLVRLGKRSGKSNSSCGHNCGCHKDPHKE